MATTKTLLLCFIHGFRGGDWTFDSFPKHLVKLINDEKPDLKVEIAVYPKYDTKGDLPNAVANFRQWLLDHILNLEKAAGNSSPKTKPTVGAILIGHSMGGFVASDALLSLIDDLPPPSDSKSKYKSKSSNNQPHLLFPLIHGILTFDTPFLGLSRSIFAYGAVSSYQSYSSISSLISLLALRMGPYTALYTIGSFAYKNRAMLSAGWERIREMKWEDWKGVMAREKKDEEEGRGASWEQVQQGLQMVMSKEGVTEGVGWLLGHAEFVSVLWRGRELGERLERLGGLKGVGFVDLYTTLGPNSVYTGGYFIPERTFIALPPEPSSTTSSSTSSSTSSTSPTSPSSTTTSNPAPPSDLTRFFIKEPNTHPTSSTDEIRAHLNMFSPTLNTSYSAMSSHACGLILSWASNNRGRITDTWSLTREKAWEGLSRYTIDEATGQLRDWDEKGAERSWYVPQVGMPDWNVPSLPAMPAMSMPNMPSVGVPSMPSVGMPNFDWSAYVPSVPTWSSRSGSRPPSSGEPAAEGAATSPKAEETTKASAPKAKGSAAGFAALEEALRTAKGRDPVAAMVDANAEASKKEKERGRTSGAGSEDKKKGDEGQAEKDKQQTQQSSFTSYLWSSSGGVNEQAKKEAEKEKDGQSWLQYGYSYLPGTRSRSRAGSQKREGEEQKGPEKEKEEQTVEEAKPTDAEKAEEKQDEPDEADEEEQEQKEEHPQIAVHESKDEDEQGKAEEEEQA